ncbi:MAG TPA: fasciclin domain-containing protein, partial [Bacteroidia bacterium]|nr:fasciclin domain-containing protein [Bacteroidia bacterium]
MKKLTHLIPMSLISLSLVLALPGCQSGAQEEGATNANQSTESTPVEGGQSTVEDDVSQPNVVKVAVGSKDHTTLVEAVEAAELVDALSNNGPFTVFAPTNDAFAALPAGTVEGLL